jgi:hypothetical protein
MSDKADFPDSEKDQQLFREERRDHVLIEILMRLSSLERLIIDKGLIDEKELLAYIQSSYDLLMEQMKSGIDETLADTMLNKGMKN